MQISKYTHLSDLQYRLIWLELGYGARDYRLLKAGFDILFLATNPNAYTHVLVMYSADLIVIAEVYLVQVAGGTYEVIHVTAGGDDITVADIIPYQGYRIPGLIVPADLGYPGTYLSKILERFPDMADCIAASDCDARNGYYFVLKKQDLHLVIFNYLKPLDTYIDILINLNASPTMEILNEQDCA